MAISVISISSYSSEDSVGTPAGRVILFGTIPTTIPDTTPVITPPATQTDIPVIPIETPIIAPTIPPSPDYTPASPDYSPASDSESDPSDDPSSDHIPPLPSLSPFLSLDDNTTDNDTPDTPPSPTHVEVTYDTLGDLVQRFHDHTQAIPVHRIQAIEGVQREQGHRIVGVESAVTTLTERVAELERVNRRLRGTVSVESQRVDRLQRGMSRMQRELRQMRRI
ncbi:hypothetical protein Tco_0023323 [Tanacetum coccineum]